MAGGSTALSSAADITPKVWMDFVDEQMTKKYHPNTINNRLFRLKAFLYFLDDAGIPVCQRMLQMEPLKSGPRLPKDVPISLLRRLLQEVEVETRSRHASHRRLGIMDRAWVFLMLYSGLRTCEVRRLKTGDIDWENRRIRIEQSKGLKDRVVYMNMATVRAIHEWLDIRGQEEYLSDHVFIYRHQPLSRRYCGIRLRTYGKRSGTRITPHQLRHSCATLLLNEGAPVLTVQALLGHERVDTTLGYARLYDGKVAADYYKAMGQIERQFAMPEDDRVPAPGLGDLIALVDSLGNAALNESQRQTLQLLRQGIQSLTLKMRLQIDHH